MLSKKFKVAHKPLDEFEDESEVNYYEDYKVKKHNQKLRKKKLRDGN